MVSSGESRDVEWFRDSGAAMKTGGGAGGHVSEEQKVNDSFCGEDVSFQSVVLP